MKYILFFLTISLHFIAICQVFEDKSTSDKDFDFYTINIEGMEYVVQSKLGSRDVFVRDTTSIYNYAGIYNTVEKQWVLEPKFEDINVFYFQNLIPMEIYEERFIYFANELENEIPKTYIAFNFSKENKGKIVREFGFGTSSILESGLLINCDDSEDELNPANKINTYFFNNQAKEIDTSYSFISVDNYTITAKKGNNTYLLDAQSFEILASGDSINKVQVLSEYESLDDYAMPIEVIGFVDTEKPLYLVYNNNKMRLFDYEHNKHFVGPFDITTKVQIQDNHVNLPNFDFIYFEKPGANYLYLNGAEDNVMPFDTILHRPYMQVVYNGEVKIIDETTRRVVFCCNGELSFSGDEFQEQQSGMQIDPETSMDTEVNFISSYYPIDFLFKKIDGKIQLLSEKMKLSSQLFDSLYKATDIIGEEAEQNYRYIGVFSNGKKGIYDFKTGRSFIAENIKYFSKGIGEISFFTGLINQTEYYFDEFGKVSRQNNHELFSIKKAGKLVGVVEEIDEENEPFAWSIPAKYKAIEIKDEYWYPLFNVQDPITKLWGVVDQNDQQITPLIYISAPEIPELEYVAKNELLIIGEFRKRKKKLFDFVSIAEEHHLFTTDIIGLNLLYEPLIGVFKKTKKQVHGEELFFTKTGSVFLIGDYYPFEYERRFNSSTESDEEFLEIHAVWTKIAREKKYYVNSWYEYWDYLTEERKFWTPALDSAACAFDLLFTEGKVGVRFVNSTLEDQKNNPEVEYELVDLFTNKIIAKVNKCQLINFWNSDVEFKWENQQFINLNDEEVYSNIWLEPYEVNEVTEIRLMGIKKGEKKPTEIY